MRSSQLFIQEYRQVRYEKTFKFSAISGCMPRLGSAGHLSPFWWRWCCNLSGGMIVWFTTNGMCVKNNTIICVAWASNSKRDCEHDLYCCLLPRCEALRTCRSGFPIATVNCLFAEFVSQLIRMFSSNKLSKANTQQQHFVMLPIHQQLSSMVSNMNKSENNFPILSEFNIFY